MAEFMPTRDYKGCRNTITQETVGALVLSILNNNRLLKETGNSFIRSCPIGGHRSEHDTKKKKKHGPPTP